MRASVNNDGPLLMPPFDPRREPIRFAPTLAAVTVAVCAAGMTMAARAEHAPAKGAKAAAESGKTATGKASAETTETSKSGAKAKVLAAKAETKPEAKPAAQKAAKTAKAGSKTETVELAKAESKTSAAKTSKAGKTPEPAKSAKLEAPKPGKAKPEAAKPAPVELAKAAPDAPKYKAAQLIKVKIRRGETLEAAIRRAEASPDEAKTAAAQVAKALGAQPRPGQLFAVEVAPREGRVGAGRLMALTMKSSRFEPVALKRGKTGALALVGGAGTDGDSVSDDAGDGKAVHAKLITGEVRGSLYGSARKAGVGGGQIGEIVRAFAAKVDFQRELKRGDKFTVVYDDAGKLLYAKIKAKGSYRFARRGGEVLWLDDDGKSLKSGLLRSPVDGARMSSRFGMRMHPILGYAKMHQGIDFAAVSGTPVMAAGDGVVVEARRWGGYGNWLRIKHASGYESGYAHLSRYASGLQVGDRVHQGQLVAYVGSTGASTGPHLHHEIWLNGKRVDPKGARIPTGFALEGAELVAFKAQQAKVEAVLDRGQTRFAGTKAKAKVAGLRPAKSSDAA